MAAEGDTIAPVRGKRLYSLLSSWLIALFIGKRGRALA